MDYDNYDNNLFVCYPRFEGNFFLHFQTLKLEIGFFSEALGTSYEITRHNVLFKRDLAL